MPEKKNENNLKEKKKTSKVRRIISWIINCVFGAIILAMAGIQIYGLTTKDDNYGVVNYFGTQVLVVVSDSMEPDIMTYSAVFVQKVDPNTVEVGNDVTFFDKNGTGMVMTHRILEVNKPTEENGETHFQFVTHGINKNSNQSTTDQTGQRQYFSEEELIGVVTGSSLALGYFLTFLTSWWGLLIILLIPTLYLIISSVIDIVKAVNSDDDENDDSGNDKNGRLSSKDKERLKQELLQQMISEKKAGDASK